MRGGGYHRGRFARRVGRAAGTLALGLLVGATLPLPQSPNGAAWAIASARAETVSSAIVVYSGSSADPRYRAMRADHLAHRALWRERGAVLVGVFADGTQEIVGDDLPTGITVASLRRAATGRSDDDFTIVVMGSGARLLHVSGRPLARDVLLAAAERATGTVAPAMQSPIVPTAPSAASAAHDVPVPRMRPIARVGDARMAASAVDPMVSSAVPIVADPAPAAAIPIDPATMRWSNSPDAPVSALLERASPTWRSPVPRSAISQRVANKLSPPRAPTSSPAPPRDVSVERNPRETLDPGTRRRFRENGFERALLPPMGVREMARIRFAYGPAPRGPRDGLLTTTACDLAAASPEWLGLVERRMARQPRLAVSNHPSPSSTAPVGTYSAPNAPS